MIIRLETASDIDAITKVTVAAFEHHPISRHTEQHIIHALRQDKALTMSLVADIDGQVVGHAAFSPVAVADGAVGWYGLGPVSVLPAFQRQGVGQALIRTSLSLLQQHGAQGCVLVGDPNYYRRFGFRHEPSLIHEGVPQEVFLALSFTGRIPSGKVMFHRAFNAVC